MGVGGEAAAELHVRLRDGVTAGRIVNILRDLSVLSGVPIEYNDWVRRDSFETSNDYRNLALVGTYSGFTDRLRIPSAEDE